jgi:hypothetical protein
MDTFLENAQQIFDVARSASDRGDNEASSDFALLIRPDGGLHFVMESPFSIEAAAIHAGAETAYRVTHSRDGVRVEGRSVGRDCILQERSVRKALFPDQAFYRITSPLLTSSTSLL